MKISYAVLLFAFGLVIGWLVRDLSLFTPEELSSNQPKLSEASPSTTQLSENQLTRDPFTSTATLNESTTLPEATKKLDQDPIQSQNQPNLQIQEPSPIEQLKSEIQNLLDQKPEKLDLVAISKLFESSTVEHNDLYLDLQREILMIWGGSAILQKNLKRFPKFEIETYLLSRPFDTELIALLATYHALKDQPLEARRLFQTASLHSSDDKERIRLEKLSEEVIENHILFLKKNKLWTELISFLRIISIPGESKYMSWQLELAKALWQLREVDEAIEILDAVSYDHQFATAAQNVISEIHKSYNKEVEKSSPQIEIPLIQKGNSYFVRAKINNQHEAYLLVDTGASQVMLSFQTAQKSGIGDRDIITQRWFITAGGRMKSPIVQINNLKLNQTELSSIEAGLTHKENIGDGILGMNFLKFFHFSMDTDRNVLILKRKGVR